MDSANRYRNVSNAFQIFDQKFYFENALFKSASYTYLEGGHAT